MMGVDLAEASDTVVELGLPMVGWTANHLRDALVHFAQRDLAKMASPTPPPTPHAVPCSPRTLFPPPPPPPPSQSLGEQLREQERSALAEQERRLLERLLLWWLQLLEMPRSWLIRR